MNSNPRIIGKDPDSIVSDQFLVPGNSSSRVNQIKPDILKLGDEDVSMEINKNEKSVTTNVPFNFRYLENKEGTFDSAVPLLEIGSQDQTEAVQFYADGIVYFETNENGVKIFRSQYWKDILDPVD